MMMNWIGFLIVLILSLASLSHGQDDMKEVMIEFLNACASGDVDGVKGFMEKYPDIPKMASSEGETCIHLTSVSKSVEVTKLMIKHDADVNHRVTHARGLRMTPLSWHVYGGNYDIVKLLVENGGEVNAVFDYQEGSDRKITAMDIASQLNGAGGKSGDDDEPDNFAMTYEYLQKNGGKKYEEL